MKALVGYTGFVGSNLYASGAFDQVYNSKNIEEAYGTNPELLVYAGVRAEKYLANNDPQKDLEQVMQARENIRKIAPKKLVLISTIDVFKVPQDVDEDSKIDTDGLHAYGYDRYQLELGVREDFEDACIVRLPSLFGRNIKKNFIYDYINVIPFMLKKDKFKELSDKSPKLNECYKLQDNGFYKLDVKEEERERLKDTFRNLGFTAMNFTDSRSIYQFYDLSGLWKDIETALKKDIRLLHLATEPISAGELYEYLEGKTFTNLLSASPANYRFKSKYANEFGGKDGFIYSKEEVLKQIGQFVREYKD